MKVKCSIFGQKALSWVGGQYAFGVFMFKYCYYVFLQTWNYKGNKVFFYVLIMDGEFVDGELRC